MDTRPWLDYTGQTTAELLACKETHRIDSLLCAFEEAIQLKQKQSSPDNIAHEERLVLAIQALQREINNGGFHQFFSNSSCEFVPVISESLRRIGCVEAATITEQAIAILKPREVSADAVARAASVEDSKRDELLDDCDRQFYRLTEIEPALFRFIEGNEGRIVLRKAVVVPRPKPRKLSNQALLSLKLFLTRNADQTVQGVQRLAYDLAREHAIPATAEDVEGATLNHLLAKFIKAGDLAACEPIAGRAFELTRDDPMQCIRYREWVDLLISSSQPHRADSELLSYLGRLQQAQEADPTDRGTRNRIEFMAAPLAEHPGVLPKSLEFFQAAFPRARIKRRQIIPLPKPRRRFPAPP